MLIVVLNLVILLLVVYVLLYGLKQWPRILADVEENQPNPIPVEGSKWRIPLWILLIGLFIMSFISYLYGN